MIANVAKYTFQNTKNNTFESTEHEMTRRELWMQAVVASLAGGASHSDANHYANCVLENFDKKFKRPF